jgi:NAD(P)-dependent dehydrogenase (short-subunit alcohol dehydrogenase family)
MAGKGKDNFRKLQEERPPQHQERQPGREGEMIPRPVYIRDGYRGSDKLEGKVALITGGDSGIGRSVAVHFAREGADVMITYLEEHTDAEETKGLVKQESRRCVILAGDLGEEGFCRDAVNATISHFGRLDVLVNNAAEQHLADDIRQVTAEQLEKTFRTNFFSYFYTTLAALEYLTRGAVIINTTSITAYRGSEHLVDYSATKGAIVAFTRSLAKTLAPKGIRVNGVAPGPIWTPLIPATFPAEAVQGFGQSTLMGRAGQPAEVGPCYVFLASEDGSYMTGQVLHPNGGDFLSS